MSTEIYFSYKDSNVKAIKKEGVLLFKVLELAEAINYSLKSPRDIMKVKGLKKEDIILVPKGDTGRYNDYYLTVNGVEDFVTLVKPDIVNDFMENFNRAVERINEVIDNVDQALTENKKTEVQDPYAIDLMEEILHRLENIERKLDCHHVVELKSRQVDIENFFQFAEKSLNSLVVLLRATNMGPVMRTHKDMSKQLSEVMKDTAAMSMVFSRMFKECEEYYEQHFGTDDKEASDQLIKESGLFFPTNKGDQDTRDS